MSFFPCLLAWLVTAGTAPPDPLDHVPAHMRSPKHVQFRPASETLTASWPRLSVDGRDYWVAGPPVFEGDEVESAAAGEGDVLELTLSARAGERLVRFPVDRLGVVVNKQLLAVGLASTTADGRMVSLGGLPPGQISRLETVLSIARTEENQPRVLVVPQRGAMSPGERIRVDVYVANARGLSMYQVGIDVIGGRKGRVLWEDVVVDRGRPDFVFAGKTSISGSQSELGLIGGSLNEGTVDVEKPAYLGTYLLRSSPDALGTFTVRARAGSDSQLFGERQAPMTARLGASAILVGVDVNPGFAK